MGASPFEIGLLLSVYSIAQFLFAPFWGRLSDRYGRRPILVLCLGLEVFSYLLFAFARSVEILIVARALAGFFGASLSTANAAISDVTAEHSRSKGMALIGAAFGLGFIVGPALGGGLSIIGRSISDAPFFASTFTLCAVAALNFATFIFAYFKFGETNKNLVSGGAKPDSKVSAQLLRTRILGMVEVLKRPVVGPLVFVFFLASAGMSCMEATLALFVADRFGWGLKEVSLGFVYIGVLATFNQGFLVRRLLPLYGEKKLLRIGTILMALSFTFIGLSSNLWILALAMTLLPFGQSLTNPAILGSVSLLSPANEQGKALGSTQSFASLGRIIGPAVGGWAYGSLSQTSPYFISGFLLFAGAWVVYQLGQGIPSTAKAKEA